MHLRTILSVALTLLLSCGNAVAQPVVNVKCLEGSLKGKFRLNGALMDSISVECARSIYNVEVLNKNNDPKAEQFEVMAFQLSVIQYADTTIFNGDATVTPEMKTRLMTVMPGNKIYFQAIRVKSSEFGYRTTEPLGFIVK